MPFTFLSACGFVVLANILTEITPRTYAAIGIGVAMGALWFKIIFKDFHDFLACFGHITGRDSDRELIDVLIDNRPEPEMDHWSLLKLGIWLGITVGCGYVGYNQLPGWFPSWFPK